MAFFWKTDTKLQRAMVAFAKARGQVYVKFPRLYDTMDLCHVSVSDIVPTMGVAPRKNGEYDFWWNSDFVNDLTDRQLEGVIKHELLHLVFEHTTSRLPNYDFDVMDENVKVKADDVIKARIWNLATDCAINQFIRKDLVDPAGKDLNCVFPENFNLPEWLNAEAYYRLLADQFKDALDMLKELQKKLLDAHKEWEQEGQEGKGQGKGQSQKSSGNGSDKSDDANGDGEDGEGEEEKKSTSTAGHGGATDTKPGESKEIKASDLTKGKGDKGEEKKDDAGEAEKAESEKEANDQKIKDIAEDIGVDKFNEQADREAAKMQKGGKGAGKYGGVGANVVIMDYGAGVKATPGWMRRTKHDAVHGFDIIIEQTRKRPNRRYGNVFPGKKRQDVGNKLLIAVDISGSISMDLFAKFTQHVNKFTRFSEFDIVFFNDYLVDENGKILFSCYEPNSDPRKAIRRFKLNQKQRMGGGTNFETIMLLWNKVCHNYDGLFIFTDGEASYTTAPKFTRSINWIVYPCDYNVELKHLKHGNVYNMTNEKYTREMPKVK